MQKRDKLETMASILLEKEVISYDEIREILGPEKESGK
jgi:ATP-dependent Zn protease